MREIYLILISLKTLQTVQSQTPVPIKDINNLQNMGSMVGFKPENYIKLCTSFR